MEIIEFVEVIGSLASIFAVCLNLAMLLQIRDMWNNQTHEGINPIMILFMFLNSLFWTMYGFLIDDFFMIIPNFLGTILTPIALFLIVYFAHKKFMAKKEAKELIENDINEHSK